MEDMDAFTALAEPTRRHIMEMLAANKSLSATDIYNNFSTSPPAISQHLKVLKQANLVRVEKRAQKRIYYVNPEPMKELEKWIQIFTKDWQDRHDRLEAMLRKQMAESEPPA
ncbi:MAG: helix-turn-helix transcriptional regulator [Pyrinomonadaceae bacterium]|nr:helix-turn-helix transcriptional regulator [Pyrinomonadaceae bacterium]